MQKQKRYAAFTMEDFVADEYFQEWVLRPNDESDLFWLAFQQSHSDQQSRINDARLFLSLLRFRDNIPPKEKAEISLVNALAKIEAMEIDSEPQPVSIFRRFWRVAAIWIIVLATAGSIYFLTGRQNNIQVSTSYGQLDTVFLPEQSNIVLNANSSLSYKKFKKGEPREVWLDGEAFFTVRHLADNSRFLVHTGDAIVEVLGTSFNIRKRRGRIEIALLTGSIRILVKKGAAQPIIMKPGEVVSTDTAFSKIVLSSANTGNNAAWTQKRLVLNDPTVQEIVNYLEDIYGKKILLGSPAIAFKKVEGPILLDSLQDALFVLSTVLNVNIVEEHDTLILKQR